MDEVVGVIAALMSLVVFGTAVLILFQGGEPSDTSNRPSGGRNWWDKDPPF